LFLALLTWPLDSEAITRFGVTDATAGKTQRVTVVLPAGGTLARISVRSQGIEEREFTNAGGGSCEAGVTYAAKAICTVNVTFSATHAGAHAGAVVLLDTKGSVVAAESLQATSSLPQAAYTPATPGTIAASGVYPSVVAVDGSGNLYYADGAGSNLYKAALSSGVYTQTLLASGFSSIAGLAVDGSGNLYVADKGAGAVYMETLSSGGYTQTVIGSNFSQPVSVAVDGSGDVYIADAGNQNVYLLALSSGAYTQSTIASSSSLASGSQWTPQGLALVSSAGLDSPVYVWDSAKSLLYMLSPLNDGSKTYTLAAVTSAKISGVATDGNGNLYLTMASGIYRGGVATTETGCSSGASCEGFTGSLVAAVTPSGGNLAIDGSGNIYYGGSYASASEQAVAKLDVADPPSLSFATTAGGATSTDSPQTVTIYNIGTAALQFSAVNYPVDFPEGSGVATDCTASTALTAVSGSDGSQWSAGGSCTLTIDFTPVAVENGSTSVPLSESVSVTTNTPNATGAQSIAVSGTETKVAPTVVLSSTATAAYITTPVTFTATVTAGGASLPGSVSFYCGSTLLGTATLSSGVSVLTTSALPLGASVITAVYVGSAVYAATSSNAITVTVSQPVPTVTLASSANPSMVGSAVSLSATVSGVADLAAPSGTVSFSSLGYNPLSEGPFTASQQGWATDGTYNYTFDTRVIYKRNNDAPWSAVTYNASPFTGLTPGVDHLGDGEYYNGKLYLPVENYGYAGGCTFMYQTLAVYSATVSGLPLVNSRNIVADGHEVSAVAVVPSQNALYVSSFCDGSKLWIYDMNTLTLTGTLPLSVNIPQIQGLSYNAASNSLFMSADTNWGGEIYQVSLAGAVTPVYQIMTKGEVEGIDFTQANLGYMLNDNVYFLSSGTTSLGTATLNGGVATLTTSALVAGTDSITATYTGDSNYLQAASNTVMEIVNQYPATVMLAETSSSTPVASAVSFIATVTGGGPAPSGTVSFYIKYTPLGTVTLSGGVATLTTSALAVGTDSIIAVYAGDANYLQAASNAVTETIDKITPTVRLVSSTNSTTVSSSVTFTTTVTGAAAAPTGKVAFYSKSALLGTATLSGGVATLTTSALAAGTDLITAIYAGDANYLKTTSNSVVETINALTPIVTLVSSAVTSAAGSPVTFTAKVTGSTIAPTGTVTYYAGTTPFGTVKLNGSNAIYTTRTLALGNTLITANYSGDQNYHSTPSNILTETIVKQMPTVKLVSSANPSKLGSSVTFTATVSGGTTAPTGKVAFYAGSKSLGTVMLSSGKAVFSTAQLKAGSYAVIAQYAGDGDYGAEASNVLKEIIEKQTPIVKLTASANPSNAGNLITFTATVSGGTTAFTGKVAFYSGNKLLGTATLKGGKAIISTAQLSAGSYTVVAKYEGDENYGAGASNALKEIIEKLAPTIKLMASANPSNAGNSITFTVTVSGGRITPTGKVAFYSGNKLLGTATLKDGKGVLSIAQLSAGSYTVVAKYEGDSNFSMKVSNAVKEIIKGKLSL
jgi:hypothetical protein